MQRAKPLQLEVLLLLKLRMLAHQPNAKLPPCVPKLSAL
jgi:hypothetical protein